MALDGCGLVCKYILIIFNIIFALLGFAFLGLGLWLRFSDNTRAIFEVQELNSSAFVIAATVLIILGSVMLFVVAFGDYGACNEKRCALQVFSVLVTIMAAFVVAVGVLAYSNKETVELRIVEFYTSMYTLYLGNGDPVIGATLTFIHKTLHCCGVTGITPVEKYTNTCPKPDGFFEHFKMPSCPGIIADVFDSKASLMLGIFVGAGALLIIALVCAIILLKQVKRVHQEISAYYTSVY